MRIGRKSKKDKNEEVEVEEEEKKTRKSSRKEKKTDEPKDSTRFLPVLFLIIFLFISYLFWVK